MEDLSYQVEFSEASDIAYYQMDILRCSNDDRFVDVIAGTNSSGIYISFKADGHESLEQYYSEHSLSREGAVNIIRQITDNADWCMKNLLDPACLMTQPCYIYFMPQQSGKHPSRIKMIYSPVRKTHCRLQTARLSNEFMSFLELSSPETLFSTSEMAVIREIDLYHTDKCLDALSSLNCIEKTEKSIKKNCGSMKGAAHVFSAISVPLFIISQAILIYGAFYLFRNLDRFSSPLIALLIVVFMLILLAGADIFVLLNRASPFRKYVLEFFSSENVQKKKSVCNFSEEKTVLIESSCGNTRIAMLCSGVPGTPEESRSHKGFILSDDFLVGRDAAKVDFTVSGSSVGRVHARITRKQNSFFIEDLGSHNGTYIDGQRIKKGTDNHLPDKCRISFADKEYYFVVS